jgi:hypothetical protein
MIPLSVETGDRKKLCTVSPRPDRVGTPSTGLCRLCRGRIVRVIRFQLSLRLTGMTG